jgi:molecular chaperone DnaJ
MKKKRDYYEVLSVEKNASVADIKAAYRKAAMKYHPDRNQGDSAAEEKFKEAGEAYQVLSDEQKRQIYDRFGHQGLSGQGYRGPQDASDIFSQFSSIFEDFFGFAGSDGGNRARRGSDLRYDLSLSFHEGVFGVEKEIEFAKKVGCSTCAGSGCQPGYKPETCTTCDGAGQVRRNQGFFSIAVSCPSCDGVGRTNRNPCKKCRGEGKSREKKKIAVKVPAGVESGLKLRVSGEGEEGSNGGPSGDLYVFLEVQESPEFVRDGANVMVRRGISFVKAALGCQLEITNLEGKTERVEVEAGTQHGHRIVLNQAGIPKLRGSGRGDLIVEISVEIPKKLTKEQRQLLEKYADVSQEEVVKSGQGFFQRIFE